MSANRFQKLPTIDLNQISDEAQLLPVVKNILLNYDTFILKNYANQELLESLANDLNQFPPDIDQGFDANFTGALTLENGSILEQYITSTDNSLQFNRFCNNQILNKIQSRLFKIGMFFTELCIKSLLSNDLVSQLSDISNDYATKLTHYYNKQSASQNTLPNGESFEYLFSNNYQTHSSSGILSIFPSGSGIRYKPAYTSSDDNIWINIDEENCLVIHTGSFLSTISNGLHAVSPIQLDVTSNIVELTIFPNLNMDMKKHLTMAEILLNEQIHELPQVAEQFYTTELSQQRLKERIIFYKHLFSTTDTVLSLYSISRGTNVAPNLDDLLPQMTNLMKRKISQTDVLKMITLWPQAYIIESNLNHELTIQLPKRDMLSSLINHSRKLDFSNFADQWYNEFSNKKVIPKDVPEFKINKRRGSDDDHDNFKIPAVERRRRMTLNNGTTKQRSKNLQEKYLSNNKDPSRPIQREKNGSQSALLERLKEKERRSAIMLSERQQKYKQFLAIKMKQVFNIIFSIEWNKPYTMTQLRSLIVDSLQDSNNPIGPTEAEEVLLRLQNLLSDEISVTSVDGGLKVLRWKNLDKQKFETAMNNH